MTHKSGPGFPIRRSSDHCLITGFPKLIAGFHVLHRLSTPRHPPLALIGLVNHLCLDDRNDYPWRIEPWCRSCTCGCTKSSLSKSLDFNLELGLLSHCETGEVSQETTDESPTCQRALTLLRKQQQDAPRRAIPTEGRTMRIPNRMSLSRSSRGAIPRFGTKNVPAPRSLEPPGTLKSRLWLGILSRQLAWCGPHHPGDPGFHARGQG